MYNILTYRYLGFVVGCVLRHIKAALTYGFDGSQGAVLQALSKVLDCLKCLVVRLLNDIYIVVDVIECAYLCKAKVPYYGRSAYRH